MAVSDFYSLHTNYNTRLSLHFRDSKGQVIDAAAAALDLLKDVEVDAIVGLQNLAQTNFIMDLGNRSHVPIISFSATSPFMLSQSPYFIQTALGDDAQVGAISSIIEAFQWRQVTVIYEDTDYGNGLMPSLCTAFRDINAQIAYRSQIPLSATDDFIVKELNKMITMQTRVFVVHMSLSLGTRLFLKAKEIGMLSEGYVWIITDGLMDLICYMDSPVIEAMQGVLGVRPRIPRSKKLDSFEVRWRRKFLLDNPAAKQAEISIFGLWAYDTVWALALAAEKVGVKERVINLDNNITNVTNIFGFGISQTGPKLLKAMLETRFLGLSGEFDIVNGRLRSSAFQIMNVIGKGKREVGIWKQSRGISRGFHTNKTDSSLNLRESFRGIVWPGETTFVPKGWEIRKLRIAVPVKRGFTEFVKVEIDPLTNATKFSGISINIFDAVIRELPYALPYEYHPFKIEDDSAGGVSMIVPIKYKDTDSIWTFLKPMNMKLWLTSIAFFILTGFAVWVLEHRIDSAFSGQLSHHVGLILWFPLSETIATAAVRSPDDEHGRHTRGLKVARIGASALHAACATRACQRMKTTTWRHVETRHRQLGARSAPRQCQEGATCRHVSARCQPRQHQVGATCVTRQRHVSRRLTWQSSVCPVSRPARFSQTGGAASVRFQTIATAAVRSPDDEHGRHTRGLKVARIGASALHAACATRACQRMKTTTWRHVETRHRQLGARSAPRQCQEGATCRHVSARCQPRQHQVGATCVTRQRHVSRRLTWQSSVCPVSRPARFSQTGGAASVRFRMKVKSYLARLVLAVWLFVVLILSSSYTASLSSRFTVQSLQPTVTDVNQLIKNGDYVGYQYGSFIADILTGMGFQQSQLKPQNTREECDGALLKGSKNGGISAFFHSAAPATLFLSQYCGKYTAVSPIYRTQGYGFVFPRGSPLVADVSRAVVTVMEGKKYADLSQSKCTIPDSNSINSTTLTLQSFRGVFMFTGCVTVLCLLVYLAKYTYDNKDHPEESNPEKVLELNDVGDSSLFTDTPIRNSNSIV
ncbi:hypothetical protein Vadar_014471 [Vaccinium darrowii]|uniref:Uncharacterized protein n=1 Tax=Vaccinium darrowii TaxID=229202 RepID=A0ACB7ZLP2_9ERIC|nr:hypothetical protein Vadar_014471 [Vaccinium darrowii]